MKNNRLISFILVSFVYIVSITIGIVIYNSLNFHFAINLLIADVASTIVVFIFSLLLKNASTYLAHLHYLNLMFSNLQKS